MLGVKLRHPSAFYTINEKIGSGSYGNVFKAKRLSDDVVCALKSMAVKNSGDLLMIRQEINTMISCRHANVVEFYEVFLCRKELWISMEFCGGGTYNDIVDVLGPLEEIEIAYSIKYVMEGLNYIHLQKNLHRDIKGANILLTADGTVKIADFGVAAKLVGTLDKRKSIIGSPYWMAPEVITAKASMGYNNLCDVWSAGILAIELAETVPPLYRMHPMDALSVIGRNSYTSPTLKDQSKWSASFNIFISKSLAKNFKKRLSALECLTTNFLSNPALTKKVGFGIVKKYFFEKHGQAPPENDEEDEVQKNKYIATIKAISSQQNQPSTNDQGGNKTITEENSDESSDDTPEDETDDYYNHFPKETDQKSTGVEISDWRKHVKRTTLSFGIKKTPKKSMGAYLINVCLNIQIPPVYGAEYWIDPKTNEQKIIFCTENGVYIKSLLNTNESNLELIIPCKTLWLHVSMHNIALLLCCLESRHPTVYQFDLKSYFFNKDSDTNLKKSDGNWRKYMTSLYSLEHAKIQKCIAFYVVKNPSDPSRRLFSDFLISKSLEKVSLFRWYTQGRHYAFVKELSCHYSQTAVMSPIIRASDPYPFACFGVKAKEKDSDQIEFKGIDFNSTSNWFTSFIDENKQTSLQVKFFHQTNEDKIILGFHDYALIYNANGQSSSGTKITFPKSANDYVVLKDELMIIHKHGIIAKTFDNKLTQNIIDSSKTFRLLGSNGIVVLETTSKKKVKDILVLLGHEDF